MKKVLSIMLIICIFIPFCLISCKKKDVAESSVGVSSDITYTETSSEISKTEENGEFTFEFDPYVLTSDVKKAMGTTQQYRKFVDAVLTANDVAPISSRDEYDMIRFAIGENFPLAALVSSYRYDSANKQILLSYKYKSTHNDKISEFKSAVRQVFENCVKSTDDDAIAAISLYSWIAKNIEIEEQKVSVQNSSDLVSSEIALSESTSSQTNDEKENTSTDIYNTLIDKKGTASSVSALYNFLLMQLGIECKTVSAWEQENYKTWNMIKLDSKWYHCDLASEQISTEGEGLKFFGMTQEKVTQNISSSELFSGQWKWFTNKIPKSNSSRFIDFSNIVSWEMNPNRDGITAYTEELSRFSWNVED